MTLTDLVYIDETGYHYADYPSFLQWLQDAYREIYGADVYLEPDSQDGQFLAILAQAFYDNAANGAAVYNSRSPSTAQGAGLASVVKINGIKKRVATNSTVDLVIVGQVGTIINNGVAQDTLGNKWLIPNPTTIPVSGTITVTATCELKGAISAQANTITKIFTPTRGWQTVNNPVQATEGIPVESDAELRVRQSQSVAIPSKSIFEGTVGAVSSLDGVSRVKGYENDDDVTDSDGLPPHSISIVAEGGDSVEIAEAIATHKTPGTKTYGSTGIIVFDEYGVPNTINFYRPTIVGIKAEVEITALTGYSSAYADLIKQAVADAINILKIGEDVIVTKLYVPANLPGNQASTTYNIIVVKISKLADPLGTSNVDIAFNEAAECLISNVTITVVP